MARYARPPVTFEELVAPFPADVQAVARALRAVVREQASGTTETVSGGSTVAHALYSRERLTDVVCVIQPAETHCKLYLHHVRPGDVPGLALEGAGKSSRHVKVASVHDARRPELGAALRIAMAG